MRIQFAAAWLVAGFSLLSGATLVGGAQGPKDPLEQVFADWRLRQDQTHNLRYTLVGQGMIPKGKRGPAGTVVPRDFIYKKERVVTLDMDNNRMSKTTLDSYFNSASNSFFPLRKAATYDGSVTRVFIPRAGNTEDFQRGKFDPELWLVTGKGGIHLDPDDRPILLAHGIVASSPEQEFVGVMSGPQMNLRPRLNPDNFSLHTKALHGDRECLVLRTKVQGDGVPGKFYELWVDPALESAVVRFVWYYRWKIYESTDIQYQKTPHGWLPESWSRSHSLEKISGAAGWLEQWSRFRVKEVTVNRRLDAGEFTVALKPGMVVVGTDKGHYRVEEDGKSLARLDPGQGELGWLSILRVLIGLALLMLVLWCIFRYFKGRRRALAG